jgi:hypothetical protein
MTIREINTNSKFATVTFDYDELRCLCNSLYEVSKLDDAKKDKDFNNVYAKIIELFSLVKHCKIPAFELKLIYELLFGTDQSTEKGGE